jgi:hypothetical protein
MSSTKDYLMSIEEDRLEVWMSEHHPEVEPETEEWEAFANEYFWERDYHEEVAEQAYLQEKFELSLHSIADQYQKATEELDGIQAILFTVQPALIYRLAFAHTVTVMEAYLMYCARALLNHRLPLERFELVFETWQLPTPKSKLKNAIKHGDFKNVAQWAVSRMTFHNVDRINEYFGSALHIPPVWPIEPLKAIVDTRQDLVHRNAVTEQDSPVVISAYQVGHAVTKIRAFIDDVDTSMKLELGYFADLPVHEF